MKNPEFHIGEIVTLTNKTKRDLINRGFADVILEQSKLYNYINKKFIIVHREINLNPHTNENVYMYKLRCYNNIPDKLMDIIHSCSFEETTLNRYHESFLKQWEVVCQEQ